MENHSSDEREIGFDPDVTENIDTGLADHIEQLEEHVNGSMGVSVDDGSVSRTNPATGPEINEPTNQTGPLDMIQEGILQELGPAAEQASPQTGAPIGAGTVSAATVPRQKYDAMKAVLLTQLQELAHKYKKLERRLEARSNERLHQGTEPSTSPPVVYKVVYKTSKSDPQWQHRAMRESEYDNQKVEDSESVLEMRKEGYLSQKAEDGKDLHIAFLEKETMNIHSPYLIEIMAQAIGYYPSSKLAGSKVGGSHQSLVVSRPYRMLGGALPRFKEIREQYKYDISQDNGDMERDPEERKRKAITIEHIELLEHELNKVLEEPLKREKQGYLRGFASFDMLWLLFRPGTIVYTRINDEPRCCMVLAPLWTATQMGEAGAPRKVELTVRMWFLDFNGSYVDRRGHSIIIDSFEGTRNIRELEAYPTKYMESQSLCDKMIKRGEKYMKFLRQIAPQCQYRGFVFTKQGKDKEMKERHFYDGRVVVDPVFDYMRSGIPQGPWLDKSDVWPSETNDGSMIKFVNIDPKDPQVKLEDIHYQLITCYIRGFTLGTRRWVWLRVDDLAEHKPNVSLLQKLAINRDQMRWMNALVPRMDVRHRGDAPTKSTLRIDPIGGKGEGQVMLLHGPPGTGKTFTAECIAEYTGRPLLRLSCGELGLDPTTLEAKLWTWFRMAEDWQGVLLIDEADVYLQQRSGFNTLEKETIVAVFLRALEYYRGILFLTSNCVIKFDEAITSRTSLIIEFKNLETHERAKLRDDHRRKVELDKRYALQRDAHDQLKLMVESDKPYNGREINNGISKANSTFTETESTIANIITLVFQMALALATEDAKEIDREREANGEEPPEGNAKIEIAGKHIKMVMDSIEDFMAYQKSRMYGKSRDDVAEDDGRR